MSAPAADITSGLPVPRRLPRLSPGTLVAVIALAAAIVVPLIFGDFAGFVGARIATTAIIGLSVTVVTGYTGQLSLMPYTFVGIGVFVASHAITAWGWPFWFAALLAAAATVPLSMLVGLVSVRLRGFYFAIATLTFASAMGETLFDWEAFTGGQQGRFIERPEVFGASLAGDRAFYWLCLGTVLLVVWMVLGIQRSRIGRAMSAVRENETEAQALGVNVMKTKLVAFVVSGIIAAVGGVFHGMLLQQVTPTPYQTPYVEFLGVTLIILVVVGGMRSAWGPFLGAGIIYVQLEVFRTALFLQYFIAAVSAIAFVVILLKLPGGLVELVKHEARRVREDPLKQGLRVFVTIAVQVAFFYWIWRIST